MPLHRHDPGRVSVDRLGGFDDAIVRPRHRPEPRRQITDCLMMTAIHRCRARAERPLEQRTGLYAHLVIALLVAVWHGARALTLEVLIQRTAERNVEDLDAAADRENWQATLSRGLYERDLRRVAVSVDLTQARVRGRSVSLRSDVLTAGENQSADALECGGCAIGRDHRRNRERHEPGALERAHVRRVQSHALATIHRSAGRRDCDGRRRHDVADAGPKRGQRGLMTLDQSTRTPYRFSALLPPIIVPICGSLTGSVPLTTRTPMARCDVSSTTSTP